jgi:Cu-processing system ATP-binding protein
MFNPDILVLDEPTAGLDPISADILKEKILLENKNGKLVIITSHLLSELDDLVSHVVLMQDGTIRFSMPVDVLKSETKTHSLSKAITHILKHDLVK